ncbi:MAG: hypothetical protein GX310_02145 [Synergistaceae bacterium]|nr:hypothetical protein [Synergistaceae bacterium]
MIDFSSGYSIEEYFHKGYEEERDRQKKACDRTLFSPEFEEKALSVKKPLLLAAFAEIYCPDTVVVMPFLKRAADLNPLIRLSVFEREPFRKELEAATGTAKIPTLLFFDENLTIKAKFVEHPDGLKQMMDDADSDERSRMSIDYRRGRYNDLIEKQIADMLAVFG